MNIAGTNALPDEVHEYHHALKPAYDEVIAWAEGLRDRSPGSRHRIARAGSAAALPLFISFLLPVAPYVLAFGPAWRAGPLTFGSSEPHWFLVLWIGGAALAGLVLFGLTWLGDRLEPVVEPPRHTLSNDQMAFVAAYEAADALRHYFVGFVESHLERAQLEFERLLQPGPRMRSFWPRSPGERRMLYHAGTDDMIAVRVADSPGGSWPASPTLMPRLHAIQAALRLAEHAPWVDIPPPSRGRMRALLDMPGKVLPRLKEREDLPHIGEIAESLTVFLFGFLPDHTVRRSAAELEDFRAQGLSALDRLSASLDGLTMPHRARQKPARSERHGLVADAIHSSNPLARFAAWGLILLVLALLFASLLDAAIGISDDTFALIVIPTALVGGATLTVLQQPREIEPRRPNTASEDEASVGGD